MENMDTIVISRWTFAVLMACVAVLGYIAGVIAEQIRVKKLKNKKE